MSFENNEANDAERNWFRKESLESERKIILERKKEVAPLRKIGTSSIEKINGIQVTRTEINICYCGALQKDDDIAICQIGGEKICTTCSVEIEKKKICFGCLKKEHPLERREYLVSLYISKGVWKTGIIQKNTGIPTKDINETKQNLRNSGYIIRKFLHGYEISDTGKEVLPLYREMYNVA